MFRRFLKSLLFRSHTNNIDFNFNLQLNSNNYNLLLIKREIYQLKSCYSVYHNNKRNFVINNNYHQKMKIENLHNITNLTNEDKFNPLENQR